VNMHRWFSVVTESSCVWLLVLWLSAMAPSALHAQEMPAGVALGMSAEELRHVMPQLEKVRRPQRMAGGLVGAWRAPAVQVLGLSGEQTFFFAHERLDRVEFAGSAPDEPGNLQAFDRIVAWGRSVYGQEIAADDAGARYAEWTAGDTEVYAQFGGARASVRLVYKLRQERDASQL
jgi:hypothetical protein